MSDYDHGPYTPPSEPPLAFDARKPQRGGRGPAPITLIISVAVLAIAGAAAIWVYRGGVRGPSDGPQPVGAPVRDVKAAAPPEAQPQDPAAGLSVYKDGKGAAPAAPSFVSPPEAPGPRPPPRAVAPPAAPAPAPAAQPARPAPTIASILDRAPPVRPPAAPAAPAPKAASPALRPAAGGPNYVQIGAFSSRALADQEWKAAARIAPAAMAGKGEHVETVTRDGGAVVYRTTITGFSTRAEADAVCTQLKAAGKSCFSR